VAGFPGFRRRPRHAFLNFRGERPSGCGARAGAAAGAAARPVCHSHKWLCSPRGVAFLTLSERFEAQPTPLQAGWYAGEDVWQSCYGPGMRLATASVSPNSTRRS
jgi:hypothetical protein